MTVQHVVLALAVAVVAAPAGGIAQPQPTEQPPVIVEVSDSGFHWLDAGIGALTALAVVLLVIGLTLSVRHSNGGS